AVVEEEPLLNVDGREALGREIRHKVRSFEELLDEPRVAVERDAGEDLRGRCSVLVDVASGPNRSAQVRDDDLRMLIGKLRVHSDRVGAIRDLYRPIGGARKVLDHRVLTRLHELKG